MTGGGADPRQGSLINRDDSQRAERPFCENCRTKRLTGRQARFCSQKCGSEWWDLFHPRMNTEPPDGRPRKVPIRDQILGILHDREWHTKQELAATLRAREHSVGSRLSELRRKGFRIESDAENGNSRRAHRFRLVLG